MDDFDVRRLNKRFHFMEARAAADWTTDSVARARFRAAARKAKAWLAENDAAWLARFDGDAFRKTQAMAIAPIRGAGPAVLLCTRTALYSVVPTGTDAVVATEIGIGADKTPVPLNVSAEEFDAVVVAHEGIWKAVDEAERGGPPRDLTQAEAAAWQNSVALQVRMAAALRAWEEGGRKVPESEARRGRAGDVGAGRRGGRAGGGRQGKRG